MKLYIARQPIYLSDRALFGYELLYRNSEQNMFPGIDGNQATRELIYNALSEFQFSAPRGQYLFINLTGELLASDVPLLLNPKNTVIEILEDVAPDPGLIERIALLKSKGYSLALDDFVDDGRFEQIFPYVDFIKVEYGLLTPERRSGIAKKFGGSKKLIAEHIETQAEYLSAMRDGYSMLQGYYFSKPIMTSKNSVDISSSSYARLLREMSGHTPDYDLLSGVIEKDAALTYKLLSIINTLAYYRGRRVSSVKQALVQMGIEETRRWIMILLLREVNSDNDELTKQSLLRAHFLRRLMGKLKLPDLAEDAYLVGLLSGVADALENGVDDIIDHLGVSDEIKRAFQEPDTPLAESLTCIYRYERCAWDWVDAFSHKYRVSKDTLSSLYTSSAKYADTLLRSDGEGGAAPAP